MPLDLLEEEKALCTNATCAEDKNMESEEQR